MENQTIWTKEDLKIYTLIYCAQADFHETKIELDFIKSKLNKSNFEALHKEFEKDNDYQSIQKIQSSIKNLNFTAEDKDTLIQDIKNLFESDDSYDILEKNLLFGLKKIIN